MNISPNDNIQQKINASSPGETVNFAPGTFNIGTTLQLPGGRTYQGSGGAVLNWTGGATFLANLNGGANIAGLAFNGAGLNCLPDTSNISISRCSVTNIRGRSNSPQSNGIFYNGLSNSSFTHNSFSGNRGDGCLFGYNLRTSHVDDNSFDGNWKAMHCLWDAASLVPCFSTVLRNVFNHTDKYSTEFQGCANGLEIGFNWSDNPTPPDHATMPYSLPLSDSGSNATPIYSKGIHFHHNLAGGSGLQPIATVPWHYQGQTGYNQSWGLEFGSADGIVENCLFNGLFAVAICCTCTTSGWSYRNNVFAGLQLKFGAMVTTEFRGVLPLPANVFGNQILPNMVAAPTPQQVTSGSYWNVDSGQVSPPAPPPIVIPPVVVPPEAPVSISATLNPDGSVTCVWTGPGPLTISGSDPRDTVTFAVQSPQTVTGLPPGWTVFFSDGASKTSVQTSGTPDPTIAFKPTLVVVPAPPVTTPMDWTAIDLANAALQAAIAAAKGQ